MTKSYSLLENLLFLPTFVQERRLNKHLQGKTILLSGASFGIGECLALRLAKSGATLLLVARTEEKLIAVQQAVIAAGGKASYFAADLTKEEDLEKLLAYLTALPNGIDIFVNNAGKSIRRSIYDSLDRFHDFTRTMSLNYFGPVKLLLALIPILEKRKGQIINISALNVLMAPAPKWAAYQASKTAFDQWLRCVAPEIEARGIRTSSIYLPLVRTRMIAPTAAYRKMPAMSPEHVAKIIAKALYQKKRKYAPWWAIFGQLASVSLRFLWDWVLPKVLGNRE
jgi:short-subunit dehydrogenase